MKEQEKNMNKGSGPEHIRYGDKEGANDNRSKRTQQQTSGASGKADQERIANKDSVKEGNDEADVFDMKTLKGKVGNRRDKGASGE